MIKKLFLMLIIAAVGFSTVSCESENNNDTEQSESTTDEGNEEVEDEQEIDREIEEVYYIIQQESGILGYAPSVIPITDKSEEEIIEATGEPRYSIDYSRYTIDYKETGTEKEETDGRVIVYQYQDDTTGSLIRIDDVNGNKIYSDTLIGMYINQMEYKLNTVLDINIEEDINESVKKEVYLISEGKVRILENDVSKTGEKINFEDIEGMHFTEVNYYYGFPYYFLEYQESIGEIVNSNVKVNIYKYKDIDEVGYVVMKDDIIVDYFEDDYFDLNEENGRELLDEIVKKYN